MKKTHKFTQIHFFQDIYNGFISQNQPISLIHFVTEKCNAHCPHCFVENNIEKKELTISEIEKISQTTGKHLRNISLTGGETFLREDIYDIAEVWHKNTPIKSISITTNGSLPEKINHFCKNAKKSGLPVYFFLSYDYIEEKHSEYRGYPNLHALVRESYEIIKKYNFNATFQLTLTKDNIQTAYNTYEYIRDILRIDNINCNIIRGIKSKNLTQNEKFQIAEKYREIQEQINKDINKKILKGYDNKTLTDVLINAKKKIEWKYVYKTFKNEKYISPCCAGKLLGVIYSDGSLYPCELLNKKISILEEYDYNFLECWNNAKNKNIRNEIYKSKCFCTWECAWLLNLLSTPRYYPQIIYHTLKRK